MKLQEELSVCMESSYRQLRVELPLPAVVRRHLQASQAVSTCLVELTQAEDCSSIEAHLFLALQSRKEQMIFYSRPALWRPALLPNGVKAKPIDAFAASEMQLDWDPVLQSYVVVPSCSLVGLKGGGCKNSTEAKGSTPTTSAPTWPRPSPPRPARPVSPVIPHVYDPDDVPMDGCQYLSSSNSSTVESASSAFSEVDVHHVDHYIDDFYENEHQHPQSNTPIGVRVIRKGRRGGAGSEVSQPTSGRGSTSFHNSLWETDVNTEGMDSVHSTGVELKIAAHGGHSEEILRRLYVNRDEPLGKGGFGVVYQAYDRVACTSYAVKEMQIEAGAIHTSPDEVQSKLKNLRDEFEMLAKFSHPNIVRVYNFVLDESNKVARFLMELATGGTVRQLIVDAVKHRRLPLPESTVKSIVTQALLGLHYLHGKRVLHRDLKPDNLLLGEGQVVKLTDFGTSKATLHAMSGTTTTVIGTVWYMSPESISNHFSFGSDIWSIGATLLELLTGKHPWSETGLSGVQLVFHIGNTAMLERRPGYPPNLSPELQEVLDACFKADARLRPSAAALLKLPWFKGVENHLPTKEVQACFFDIVDRRTLARPGYLPMAASELQPELPQPSPSKTVHRAATQSPWTPPGVPAHRPVGKQVVPGGPGGWGVVGTPRIPQYLHKRQSSDSFASVDSPRPK